MLGKLQERAKALSNIWTNITRESKSLAFGFGITIPLKFIDHLLSQWLMCPINTITGEKKCQAPNLPRNVFLGVCFKHFLFYHYLGKISNLTNIFQMGWFNHQLGLFFLFRCTSYMAGRNNGADFFLLSQGPPGFNSLISPFGQMMRKSPSVLVFFKGWPCICICDVYVMYLYIYIMT